MEYGNIIGLGNTATVYEWQDGKVLKLFKQGYPKEAVEIEFHNAMAVRNMNFLKPKAYTPVPVDANNRDMLLRLKKSLSDSYLEQMNVTRDMIKDYLSVIIIVRKGECPNE